MREAVPLRVPCIHSNTGPSARQLLYSHALVFSPYCMHMPIRNTKHIHDNFQRLTLQKETCGIMFGIAYDLYNIQTMGCQSIRYVRRHRDFPIPPFPYKASWNGPPLFKMHTSRHGTMGLTWNNIPVHFLCKILKVTSEILYWMNMPTDDMNIMP